MPDEKSVIKLLGNGSQSPKSGLLEKLYLCDFDLPPSSLKKCCC